jgi:protein phosphatase 1 regulatory subunit 7
MQRRIDNPAVIDADQVAREIEAGHTVVIQYSEPIYGGESLAALNTLCVEHGVAVEVRFYGHYDTGFDARTVEQLPDVAALCLDCLFDVKHLNSLCRLTGLRQFSLGVFELSEPDILGRMKLDGLEKLVIGATRKRSIDLDALRVCRRLRGLFLSEHTTNIETLADLPALEQLSLGSIGKRQTLEFVSTIRRLRELTLILGGRNSIAEIQVPGLEVLKVIRVRGLEQIETLASFPMLRSLNIDDQIRIRSLAFGASNDQLRSLWINNCKTLQSIEGIEHLKNLKRLDLIRTAIDIDWLLAQPLPPSLKSLRFYSGKPRLDREIRARLDALGYLSTPPGEEV